MKMKKDAGGREQTTIRFPTELWKQLRQEADVKGISFNAYILLLIDRGRQAERQ